MDCHDARHLLTLLRREPGQLDAAEVDAVERHVDLCPGCQTWHRSEARFDTAMAGAIKSVTAPAALKESLAAKMRARRGVGRLGRTAWAAAAAVAFVAIGAGVYAWTRPTHLDLHEFTQFVVEPALDRDGVEQYFEERGQPITAPRQFDYTYLDSCDLVMFMGGHMVPRITFSAVRNGRHITANVYCLSRSRFGIDKDAPPPPPFVDHQFHVIDEGDMVYFVDCMKGDIGIFLQDVH